MPTTLTRGFRTPVITDAPPDITVAVGNLAADVNSKSQKYLYGAEGSLPTFAASYEGTYYYCVDTGNRYFADNLAWHKITSPGTELDYKKIVANVTITVQTEATAISIITGTSKAYDASRKRIEFFSPRCDAGDHQTLYICAYRGGTSLGQAIVYGEPYAQHQERFVVTYDDSPTAGTYAYTIKAFSSGSAGTEIVYAGAGGVGNLMPATMRVTVA